MLPQKDSARLRLGILGAGPIAQYGHLEAAAKARNTDPYALCDVATDLLEPLRTFYRVEQTYTDYDALLADPKVDAVLIATSDAFHVPATRRALAAGKHVLVEKPLGVTTQECHELIEMAEQTNLVCQVGHMKRFDPGVRAVRHFVQEDLGEVVAYKGWYCDSTLRYDMTDSVHPVHHVSANARKPSTNPKADLEEYYLLAHGSHLIDTALFLNGPVASLNGRLVQRGGMFNWFIDAEFTNGSNGHLDLTVAVRDDWREGFLIYGTQGTVEGKIHNPWYFKPAEVRCFSERTRTATRAFDNRAHFYQLQLENFADAILHRKPQMGTTLREGLAVMEVLDAIRASTESNERINLPQ